MGSGEGYDRAWFTRDSRRALFRVSACALLLVALPGATHFTSAAGDPLDYVKVGKDLLSRNGMDPAAVKPDSYNELMARDCATVLFGPVRLYVPKEGFKAKNDRDKNYPAAADTLKLAVPPVLRALCQLGLWTRVEGQAGPDDKELNDLAGMIEIGKDFDLASLKEPLTLSSLLGKDISKREQAILDKVDALLASKNLSLMLEGKPAPPIPVLVLPTRKEMIEYLCLAGVVEPTLAGSFHNPAITGWFHSYFGSPTYLGRVQILCLQEGESGEGSLERWAEAASGTDAFLVRHTLTYDTLISLIGLQGASIPNWMALGLGIQGVVSQYGNLAGRLGADSVGDVTPPRQAFVPGGRANGGTFPPNLSALRGTINIKEQRRFLEERKKAAYKILDARDAKDPERKAALAGEQTVYFNFRDPTGSESGGYLHFGPYVGQDVTPLLSKNLGYDLALLQRALFTIVAGELLDVENGAALARLLTALPGSTEDFEAQFKKEIGVTASDLERAAFDKIKAK